MLEFTSETKWSYVFPFGDIFDYWFNPLLGIGPYRFSISSWPILIKNHKIISIDEKKNEFDISVNIFKLKYTDLKKDWKNILDPKSPVRQQ